MKTIQIHIMVWLAAILTATLQFFAIPVIAQTGGIFEDGPLMNRTRIVPVTSVSSSGNVIIFGGRESGFVSSMYTDIYDPALNNFTEVTMHLPHDACAVAGLYNGTYYISGGSYDLGIPAYAGAELFDPATNSFTELPDMIYPRMQHGAAELSNQKILIAGGWYDNDAATYGEVYDPLSNSYVVTGPLVVPRASPVILPTDDGGAMIIGGWPAYGGDLITAVEYFDPVMNTFSLYQSNPIPEDPGWLIYPLNHPVSDLKMSNGNYLLRAYRSSPEPMYALISFNPALKEFVVMEEFTISTTITNGGFYDVVLDQVGNFVYLLGTDATAFPPQIGLISIDMSEHMIYYPTALYALGPDEYLYPTLTFIPENNKILLVGISSSNGSYFYATDKTILITPEIYAGIEEELIINMQIGIYPNPCSDQFSVETTIDVPGEYLIKITNSEGKVVRNTVITENKTGTVNWEFNHLDLPAGLYYFIITGETGNSMSPMIVMK